MVRGFPGVCRRLGKGKGKGQALRAFACNEFVPKNSKILTFTSMNRLIPAQLSLHADFNQISFQAFEVMQSLEISNWLSTIGTSLEQHAFRLNFMCCKFFSVTAKSGTKIRESCASDSRPSFNN